MRRQATWRQVVDGKVAWSPGGKRRTRDRRAPLAERESEGVFALAVAVAPMTELRAHHTGVTVADLERAVEFYRDVLGFEVLDRFTVSGAAFSTGVGVEGATGRFAHLDGRGVRVELVEYEPEGDPAGGDSVDQPGVIHLGFEAGDVEGFHEALPDDVETLSDPQTTESGATILFLRDPEGNLIEVIEP